MEHNIQVVPKKRRRLRKAKNEDLDNAVWEWFKERKEAGMPLDASLIKSQALTIHKNLDVFNGKFVANDAWLRKFKKHYKISSFNNIREKKSLDATGADVFIPYFTNYTRTENVSEHQTFHCSQIGWKFMNMPETSSSTNENLATVFKHKQDRFTVMSCTNASGLLKLRPVIIGKFAKPRSIKNVISSRAFPIYYRNQTNAWISSELFVEWFHDEFVPKVTQFLESMKLPLKAILLIDNSLFNRQEFLQEGNIKTYWLPPDTTSLIHPMNQGIFQCLKSKYRQKLLQFFSNSLENGREAGECIKSINLRDVVYWIAESWHEIPLSTILKAWQPLWPKILDQNTEEEITNITLSDDIISKYTTLFQTTPAYKDITSDDLKKWLYPSTMMTPDELLTDEQIIEIVKSKQENKKTISGSKNNGNKSDKKDFDDTNSNVNNNDITLQQEAKDALQKLIKYCKMKPMPFFEEKLSLLHQLKMEIDNDRPQKSKNYQAL